MYLSSGLAKSRGLFHAKIGRQRLQLMLPQFDLDAKVDGGNGCESSRTEHFALEAFDVVKEVMTLAVQDSFVANGPACELGIPRQSAQPRARV